MDRSRRRFVPSSEGLEGRQLLSTATAPATPAAIAAPNPNGPNRAADAPTIEAKLHRIQNLPFFLGQLNRDGAVPQPTVENIQNDLTPLVAPLHPGNSSAAVDLQPRHPQGPALPEDPAPGRRGAESRLRRRPRWPRGPSPTSSPTSRRR